jgi:hypothetical protein
MKKIEAYQVTKIYAIGNALGIVRKGVKDDDLHLLAAGLTGKSSIKQLTYGEAVAVIKRLEQMQGKSAPPPLTSVKTPKEHSSTPGGMTAGQQKKAWALLYDLQKYDNGADNAPIGERMCGVIRRELKIDCQPKDPFKWVDYAGGNTLIEKLKRYVKSAREREEAADG